MANDEQLFEIMSVTPPSAFCTRCRKKFTTKVKAGESIDEAILRMREEFEQHECH
jgi:hypothetical protein